MLPPTNYSFELQRGQCVGRAERELLRLRGDILRLRGRLHMTMGGDAAGVADKTNQTCVCCH